REPRSPHPRPARRAGPRRHWPRRRADRGPARGPLPHGPGRRVAAAPGAWPHAGQQRLRWDVLPIDRDPRASCAGRRRLAHRARRPRAGGAPGLELVGRLGDVHPLLVLRLRALGRAVPAGLHLLTEVIVTPRRICSTLLAAAALCSVFSLVLAP